MRSLAVLFPLVYPVGIVCFPVEVPAPARALNFFFLDLHVSVAVVVAASHPAGSDYPHFSLPATPSGRNPTLSWRNVC